MRTTCTNPQCQSHQIKKVGFYYRSSDKCKVQRYHCNACGADFSDATDAPEFQQKKRQLNDQLLMHLASGASQNRLALLLHTTTKTIARKLTFLGSLCKTQNEALLTSQPLAPSIQFDELETFEHTQCKPLSVAVAVESPTRRILGFNVSQMPATGKLAKISRLKYGKRPDKRKAGLVEMFTKISPLCASELSLKSDKCPRYKPVVWATLGADKERIIKYTQVRGALGSDTGLGELKKTKYDPLYWINHTLAMFRANINRLFRRTWNTTKKVSSLVNHLHIYTFFHNAVLLPARAPKSSRRRA